MSNLAVLTPEDKVINADIVRWLAENLDNIKQVSVIVVCNDKNESCLMRSSMNNMEKIYYWEKHKLAILGAK